MLQLELIHKDSLEIITFEKVIHNKTNTVEINSEILLEIAIVEINSYAMMHMMHMLDTAKVDINTK